MKIRIIILQSILLICFSHPIFGQLNLPDFSAFQKPVGNWLMAGKVEMDSINPKMLHYEPGNKSFVNGPNGSAKYLVSKKEYGDIEFHAEFMIPKGSNSGIYFMCRYELQIFDSWNEKNLTYYDCGGIQNRWDKSTDENDRGYNGFAPLVNACKAPGEWQSLDVIFRAPKFNKDGVKVKNASFEKVILNGSVVQENMELDVPTRGALSGEEVAFAPFRLQGGHGPIAFRNIRVRDLEHTTKSKPNKWHPLFQTKKSKANYDFVVHGESTKEEANTMFEYKGRKLKAMYKWQKAAAPYGIAVTKNVFSSYDLKFEFKWGERRFEPRLNLVRDAGLLYHCQAGTYAWPPSLEYQIQEHDCGDLWNIMGCHCDVIKENELVKIEKKDYSRSMKFSDEEKPGWNKVLVKVRGDKAKYYLNGVLINEITNASYGGLSCKSGFIALQAEYSELTYRKIKIKEIVE